jgi:predicted dehydrogenase
MALVRIGILGAATIAPAALVSPARRVKGVTVEAVAARDRDRAERFARRAGIPRVLGSYAELLDSSDIDAVYIPLPNGLHGAWTVRAVEAGKHVLCEKPFTANADEARAVADAVAPSDRVVMEAFHYRYHPLAARVRDLIASGAVGEVRHVEAKLCVPMVRFGNIRYDLGLAGGALMDTGCYALHALRTFGPLETGDATAEPEVRTATALQAKPGIDRATTVDVAYPSGATGRAIASLWSHRLLSMSLAVTGDAGSIKVFNFVAPHVYHRLTVRSAGRRFHERVPGPSTYVCQLTAFRDAVHDGQPVLTDPADAVRTMSLIDAAYRAAGLPPREPSPV